MVSPLLLAAAAGLADFTGSVLALGPLRFSRRVFLFLFGMSGGYLVTWAVADLIPLLVSYSASLVVWILVGYFGLYVIENLFASHAHPHSEGHLHGHALVDSLGGHTAKISPAASAAAVLGLFIHAFFDGAGIVASFSIHRSVGTLVFLAVLIHKVPEGASMTAILGAAQRSNRVIVTAAAGAALMTIAGGVAVWAIHLTQPAWAYTLLALSAGTFLFIGASDLIPATQKGESRATVLAVISGTLIFWVVIFLMRMAGVQHG